MRILWFCIPAYGHTNPTIEVVRELTRRGHEVRYYSFEEFREKIEGAGADFVSCDANLPAIDAKTERKLHEVSSTEMSVQSFRITAALDPIISKDVETWHPDMIVTDSACFWGKLTALKYNLPWVCSTTTFAFNKDSAQYMSQSAKEIADMVFGLPRLNREIRKLRPLGYHVKSVLDIVQNKPDDNTIVYTSRTFQPCADTFDQTHYRFVGPSVRSVEPQGKDGRPLVYASLGTVINDRPGFYRTLIEALRNEDVDLLISCGKAFDEALLGELPANVRVEHYVDQMEVLSRASLFITRRRRPHRRRRVPADPLAVMPQVPGEDKEGRAWRPQWAPAVDHASFRQVPRRQGQAHAWLGRVPSRRHPEERHRHELAREPHRRGARARVWRGGRYARA